MINEDELKYICEKASNAPYPGDDYAFETINTISRALAIYKRRYEGKKYILSLSNGEEIFFEIKPNNLAHLLGVDFKNMLTCDNLRPLLGSVLDFKNIDDINSYELLSRIVCNGNKVICHDEVNSNKLLNYYKIMIKTSCFLELTSFDQLLFGVVNFDKGKYEMINNCKYSPMATKYIISINEKNFPHSMMGLKNNHEKKAMIPETFIVSNHLENYLIEQELLLPTNLLVADKYDFKEYTSTREDRIRILNLYKEMLQKYNNHIVKIK